MRCFTHDELLQGKKIKNGKYHSIKIITLYYYTGTFFKTDD